MKSFIITIIIAAALVFGSVKYTKKLEDCSETLGRMTADISESLDEEDYAAASADIDRLSEELLSVKPFIAAFGDHSDIDLIESNLAELKVYAEYGQRCDALSRATVISVLFRHLPRNTHIRIENIL
ncbi:MAG: DUF4363 family protein [Clostridia bacterium]|nr:DUF4363 family protein [Clostridia bacterium]